MHGTNDVVRVVAAANPEAGVTEDRIRRVLRRGLIPTVRLVAGRLLWARGDIETGDRPGGQERHFWVPL